MGYDPAVEPNVRRKLVMEAIETGEMRSQEQIVKYLAERGMYLSQASVSRTLKELGMSREDKQNGYYVLPEAAIRRAKLLRLFPLLYESSPETAVDVGTLVIRAKDGMSTVIASLLEHVFDEVLGTFPMGDFTLVVTRDKESARELEKKIRNPKLLVDPGKA